MTGNPNHSPDDGKFTSGATRGERLKAKSAGLPLEPNPSGQVLDMRKTASAARARMAELQDQHPTWEMHVADGGSRWESKGGRYIVVSGR